MLRKSRMVIADLDYDYIIPIQTQIAESYSNQLDLEIITDKDYYSVFISSPQVVDIFLVSEVLYSDLLLKQNIKNLFILSETDTNESGFTYIQKYRSVKEILSIVFNKSRKTLYENFSDNRKATKVIAVCSAIGGVGKTLFSLGLAANLSENYDSVLYVEASKVGTFQGYLDDKTPITDNEIYLQLEQNEESTYKLLKPSIRKSRISYLPVFKSSLVSLNLRFDVFVNFIKEAKENNEYDLVIVDCDSSFDESIAIMMGYADRVIIVTRQDEYATYALERFISNLSGVKSGKYIVVCNDYYNSNPDYIQSSDKISVNEYIDHIDVRSEDVKNSMEINDAVKRLSFLLI